MKNTNSNELDIRIFRGIILEINPKTPHNINYVKSEQYEENIPHNIHPLYKWANNKLKN